MTKFLATIGALVLAVPLLFVFGIAAIAWRAWWLYPAWGWFLVPLGAKPIAFWHFAALMFIVNTLTHQTDTRKDSKTDWSSAFITALIFPIMTWAILWWMQQ